MEKTELNNKKSWPINYYGALATALIVTVVIGLVVGLLALLMDQLNSSYNFVGLVQCSVAVLILAVFVIVPLLITSKYGWKTVLTTFLMQAVLLFIISLIIALATSSSSNDDGICAYDGTLLPQISEQSSSIGCM